jgi:23S rRNA (uracil1939-C5)-methyltransferase
MVVRAAREAPEAAADGGREARAIELFAGAGTLTQALWAEGYAVAAYEVDAGAAAGFHATRERLGVAPERGRWCTNDLLVTGVPERLPGQEGPPDLVLLDPPRTGAKALVPWLRGTMARTVVYVSCDLATALRDVSELAGRGDRRRYDVTRLIAYDMFPHTGHQELLLVLERRGAAAPRQTP